MLFSLKSKNQNCIEYSANSLYGGIISNTSVCFYKDGEVTLIQTVQSNETKDKDSLEVEISWREAQVLVGSQVSSLDFDS